MPSRTCTHTYITCHTRRQREKCITNQVVRERNGMYNFVLHSSPTEMLAMPILKCLLPPHNLWGRKNMSYFSNVSMFDLGPMKFYSSTPLLIDQETHRNVCISYCSVAVIEYHDQKWLKKNLGYDSGGKGMALLENLRSERSHFHLKEWEKRKNRKWEEAINSQSPSPVIYFLQQTLYLLKIQ